MENQTDLPFSTPVTGLFAPYHRYRSDRREATKRPISPPSGRRIRATTSHLRFSNSTKSFPASLSPALSPALRESGRRPFPDIRGLNGLQILAGESDNRRNMILWGPAMTATSLFCIIGFGFLAEMPIFVSRMEAYCGRTEAGSSRVPRTKTKKDREATEQIERLRSELDRHNYNY